jgi:hypothetical protein
MLGTMGLFELVLMVVVFGMGVLGTIFWIWMLVDCATREPSTNDKIVWVLIIALTHWVGALIYLLVRRPRRIAEIGC